MDDKDRVLGSETIERPEAGTFAQEAIAEDLDLESLSVDSLPL